MDSQQCKIQEDVMCRMDSIFGCNVGDEEGDNNTANFISNSINVHNIETESNGNISGIVKACDTSLSHQNWINDMELAKLPKALHLLT